jgi:catechol 2,3-dioxygenase-like lactoylglutathione lyase family enzyme
MNLEQISAVTLKVGDMARSVHFYQDILGLDILYGGKDAYFSSLRPVGAKGGILNLEQGPAIAGWGRLIFYVKDVDDLWAYLREKGFSPQRPRDAEWGERYFHLPDPDGHELSFAQPLKPRRDSSFVSSPGGED